MTYKIEQIEGIGPANAAKLANGNIATTDDLLKLCSDPGGRKKTSEATGIGEKVLLKWANLADLMRISGVGGEFSELLEAAGVDTVKELRTRNAENLATKMVEVNEEKKLTRAVPTAGQVQKWIDQASTMDPCISH